MKTQESDHLYVHVPFCDGKCIYCAFYSEPYNAERADAYLKALAKEFDLYLAANPQPAPYTIYFGGGTSSILTAPQLDLLCRTVSERISLENVKEWTVEANPGTLPAEKLRILVRYGVNRVSMGAQSFDDAILERVGRRHSAADIEATTGDIRAAGITNIGLDLIACMPGVIEESWDSSMEKALRLEPNHLSIYSLTIEKGTPLSRMIRSGDVVVPDDDLQIRTIDRSEHILGKAGYERYEISNYAKRGFRCAHNVSCWLGEDYLGLGPAASSRAGFRRWTNKSSIDRYIRALEIGEDPPREEDTLTQDADATERLIFSFRLSDGVDLKRFSHARPKLQAHWEKTLTDLQKSDLLERRNGLWVLTRQGRNFADFVAYELINV